MSTLRLGPRPFLILCQITLAAILLNVVTGAAVRLSDSGLGCPDWPTCAHQRLTPPLRLHPVLEFGNRVVVFVLVLSCVVTCVAAFLRHPARRDLRWLAFGLVLGILGESVLGAAVVYSKLNAYVVMTHFMVGIALLTVVLELTLRAAHAPGRGTVVVSRRALLATRLYLGLLVVAVIAGTATTGAGPHAGGKGAKRVAIGLSDMTRIHAELVWVTAITLLVVLWTLWRTGAPDRVQQRGRVLLVVMAVQGLIGYTQYATHLPAVLVGVHVLGATLVWSAALWFHHGLSDHRPEAAVEAAPVAEAAAGAAHVPEPA